MTATLLYFAYGSNLWFPRMRQRVPSAHCLGRYQLSGFQLRFQKRGADGSAKADIHFTGEEDHRVHGVVYRIQISEQARLDQIEGGYNRASVLVVSADEEIRATTYVAAEPAPEPFAPFDWYRELVMAGGEWHGLPKDYLEALRAVAAVDDPDRERHALNWPK